MIQKMRHEIVEMPDPALPVRVFHIGSDTVRPGYPLHWHRPMEIFLVERGGVWLQSGPWEGWLREGDVGVANCGEPHRTLRFLDRTLHDVVQVDLSAFLPMAAQTGDRAGLRALLSGAAAVRRFIPQDEELGRMLRRLAAEWENRPPKGSLTVWGCASLILARLVERYAGAEKGDGPACRGSSPYVAAILAYLEKNYTGEICLKDIAAGLHISVPHMCRVFKAEEGVGIIRCCNMLRCRRACRALENGCSVTESAEAAGFSDPNYFSRIFKQVMGISPSDLRRGRRPSAD